MNQNRAIKRVLALVASIDKEEAFVYGKDADPFTRAHGHAMERRDTAVVRLIETCRKLKVQP